MSFVRNALGLAAVLLLAAPTVGKATDQILIPPGSAWKFNDSGTNLGNAWTAPSYSDASWLTGFAQLGYGDSDEATVLSYGGDSSNRYITYYFRRAFTVNDPSAVSALLVRYLRDDGCVIYLNGAEVVRSNMPAGAVTSATRATAAIGGADESAWLTAPIDPSLLVAGTNVIAVEIHQQAPTSSDISFDLELTATEAQVSGPTGSLLAPTNGAVLNSAAVTFSASVSAPAGLASATLILGGASQAATFAGPLQVEDAQITADTPTVASGSSGSINVDAQTPHAHGLLRFPTLIGTAAGQVTPGATITSAVLRLNCTNSGAALQLYRLTQDWIEDQATWAERSTGTTWASAGADGAGANAGVAAVGDCTTTGERLIDITAFAQEWSNGAPNYGVVIIDSGTDGVDFTSSESATSPVLDVVYRDDQQAVATQLLSGTSAQVDFPIVLSIGQTYSWNVQVTDIAGRLGAAPADFGLVMDAAAPDEPVLVSPLDGSAGVSTLPELTAAVSDPNGGALTVSVALRPIPAAEFTIVVLPDTQHYAEAFPHVFTSQTQWIVDNKVARNIVFVTHEGDIVEHNNTRVEWERADDSMSLLDGVVPYGMGPGNHDQPTTLYNEFFPFTRYQGHSWYGGHFQGLNDNNYQVFSAGGMDFVIVHLEFCPPAAAVSWANTVFQSYPERIGIVTTHGYLNESAQRSVSLCSSTQYLWDGLAVPNSNVRFMLSGHVHNESRRIDTVGARTVMQMLADYQDRASGGEGWLRILRFIPADDKVYVQTYSPWLGRFEVDANSEFELEFAMGGSFASAGTTMVTSGGVAAVTPARLAPFTSYEWQMTVTNASGRARTSPLWTFTTGPDGAMNRPPVAESQSVNALEDSPALLTLSAADLDLDTLTYHLVDAPLHGVLTGSAPDLSYFPAANYSGPDSLTFRVSDGELFSAPATVSITVQPVNDIPSGLGESYTVDAGGTLAVSAPGVLANDTDVDSPVQALLVTGPGNGSLTLNLDGSFNYAPNAGYSGIDVFTYRATDGAASSSPVIVGVTVASAPPPPPAEPLLAADFSVNANGFTYSDNRFRGTTQSAYASGSRVTTGGGALRVLLGGINNAAITGMSGGWSRAFTLTAPTSIVLSFRYNLNQGSDYESDELSETLASLDGTLLGVAAGDYVARVVGNGDGGAAVTTGWQLFQVQLGPLSAGTHTLILGGYNNRKTTVTERTTILIDDVTVVAQ